MNKEYMKDYRKVIVRTDKGLEQREKIDNIEEVLKTENNIEEISNLRKLVNDEEFSNFKFNKEFLTQKKLPKIVFNLVLIISFITLALTSLIGLLPALETLLWLIIAGTGITLLKGAQYNIDAEIATEKAIKKQTKLLNKELKNQHVKLKKLVKNARIDKSFTPNEILVPNQINRTQLIKDLKRKLELINFYELNKDSFILTEIMEGNFTDKEKEFLKSLIIQDEIEKENKKRKIFKK